MDTHQLQNQYRELSAKLDVYTWLSKAERALIEASVQLLEPHELHQILESLSREDLLRGNFRGVQE